MPPAIAPHPAARRRARVTHRGGKVYNVASAHDAAGRVATATDWLGKATGYGYATADNPLTDTEAGVPLPDTTYTRLVRGRYTHELKIGGSAQR